MATHERHDRDRESAVRDPAPPLYSPLPSDSEYVRLTELHSATDPAESINCDLRVVKMRDTPDYVVSSYVWGDVTIRRLAVVNGLQVNMTEQLDLALEI